MFGDDGWYVGNASGMQRLMLPGAKEYDYSLVLTNSEPADGKVEIAAKLGANVAKVKYAFFEGVSATPSPKRIRQVSTRERSSRRRSRRRNHRSRTRRDRQVHHRCQYLR